DAGENPARQHTRDAEEDARGRGLGRESDPFPRPDLAPHRADYNHAGRIRHARETAATARGSERDRGGVGVTARGVWTGAAACALVAASLARAAEPPDAHPTIDEVRAEESRRETRTYVVGRISWAYPQKAAGAIGAIVTRIPSDFDCTTTCLLRGLTVQGSV